VKVLTAAQMREVDRRTSELGVPSLILMENAGSRVLEALAHSYAPLQEHRIAVLCGKGNNGGDGLVVARQLYTRIRPRALHVVLAGNPEDMKGDAAHNYKMLLAVGCPVSTGIDGEIERATLIVDALLGTGIHGAAEGRSLELIRAINNGFPLAEVVSVDIPSGLDSDSGVPPGEAVQANHTVTFTAPASSPANCTWRGSAARRSSSKTMRPFSCCWRSLRSSRIYSVRGRAIRTKACTGTCW
jgi:hydroxyethylthiazole kinase-like uncharacterized protein yjeF